MGRVKRDREGKWCEYVHVAVWTKGSSALFYPSLEPSTHPFHVAPRYTRAETNYGCRSAMSLLFKGFHLIATQTHETSRN